ncbi:heavy metal translocating P-type ATPase metal-binding domain-containing protein [Methylomonas paludis]|uniref:Heavy metal translocating P-type ATPase metal-binding domain-containing protein n=1 Tax=Methylomonas paludis TaxID=1173101 RepID=A0A975MMX7_9GAMM|nr:heavy metal translocating P-type ATPase metal-binding domain-containing protein [Methylomonas paludis]QWF70762.1 heavy metal translocating P-type ATPase metal-binding domain-containing protein [Methylomonas paludis]
MSDDNKECDLCGLAVEVEGFELKTTEGDKYFCCEGCKGIYLMLHEEQIIADPFEQAKE